MLRDPMCMVKHTTIGVPYMAKSQISMFQLPALLMQMQFWHVGSGFSNYRIIAGCLKEKIYTTKLL